MKLMKVITALAALAFGVGAYAAAGETVTTWASESFDSLTAGDAFETGDANGSWATWNGGEDDTLKVTAWGDAAPTNSAGEVIKTAGASEKQTNYLKIETALTNGVTFAAGGLNTDTVNYQPKACDLGSADQIYFDSLVNLTAGEPDALSSVSMPDDGRLALWLQSVEIEEETANEDSTTTTTTKDVNQLCIRAGALVGSDPDNVYTADVETVSTGWHRLTVRLFKNAARSGDAIPAMAIYLDEVPVQATTAPMTADIIARLTPKCKLLADNNALFPSLLQSYSTNLGDVKGVQFAGTGDIDDIAFTTARPSFIAADQDLNYFHLTWDDNVASISYTVNSGDAVTISDLSAKAADIALTDDADTTIAVTVSHGTDVALDADAIANASTDATSSISGDVVTFSVEAGTLTPIGAIKFASNVKTVSAKVRLGDATEAKTLDATTLADLITAINNEIGEETSGEIYITLTADQTRVFSTGDEFLALGTASNENIKWTLDLNGHSISAVLAEEASVSATALITASGVLEITDTSANKDGKLDISGLNDADSMAIYNLAGGNLTITAGVFDGRVVFADQETDDNGEVTTPAGTGTFNGGKFLIGDDSDGSYLEFINDHKGDGVTFAVDSENKYYVASGSTPVVETFTVTFVNEKATETTTTETVNKDATVNEPTAPTADGFVFMGWYKTTDGTLADDAFVFTTPITENITLTAKWGDWSTFLGAAVDGVYQIDNEDELIALQTYAKTLGTKDVSFALTADIALTKQWDGIGLEKGDSYSFDGTFDGNGHKISNVVFADLANGVADSSANNYRGFFGKVSSTGVIKNLTVSSTGFDTVTSTEYGCAMIVGVLDGGTLEGCTAEGTISDATHTACGVCVKLCNGGVINSCTNKANVTGSYTKVAGVVAICQHGGTIKDCANEGTITAAGNATKAGSDGVGGIIGYADAYGTTTFSGCSNTGAIVKGDNAVDSGRYGQIIGFYNAVSTIDGVNTCKADSLAIGAINSSSAVDGLTFATVDGETATLVKSEALVSGGSYKVMAPNAAYKFTAVGSITFDTSLASVTVTQDADKVPDTDYTLTQVADSQNEKVITYTLAANAPAYTPVDAGSETTCDTEAEAKALKDAIDANKEAMINAPADALEDFDKAAYVGLFEAKVVSVGSGYAVDVVLTDDATTNLQAQVDADVKKIELTKIAAAEDDASVETEVTTTPGLYYTVYSGSETPATLTQDGDSVFATGAATTLKFKKQGARGFYKIGVSIKAIAKPAE